MSFIPENSQVFLSNITLIIDDFRFFHMGIFVIGSRSFLVLNGKVILENYTITPLQNELFSGRTFLEAGRGAHPPQKNRVAFENTPLVFLKAGIWEKEAGGWGWGSPLWKSEQWTTVQCGSWQEVSYSKGKTSNGSTLVAFPGQVLLGFLETQAMGLHSVPAKEWQIV